MEEAVPASQNTLLGNVALSSLYNLFLGRMSGSLLNLVMLVVVARLLQPSDYGIYILAVGFAALIGAFNAFGVGSYFLRNLSEMAEDKDPDMVGKILSNGLFLLVPLASISAIIGIAISPFVASAFFNGATVVPLTLMIACAYLPFQAIATGGLYNILIGFRKSRLAAVTYFTSSLVQLIASVALVYYGFGVDGALAGLVIGSVAGLLIGVYYVFKAIRGYGRISLRIPSGKEFRKVISFSMPLAFNNFLSFGLGGFAILFLGLFVASAQLGNYGIANRGISFITLIYGTVLTVLLQAFSYAHKVTKSERANYTYNKILLYSFSITLPLLVFVGVFAHAEIYLLVSSKYAEAPELFSLMVFGTAINIVGIYVTNLLVANGFSKAILKYNLISTVIQLLLVLALVPYFGIIGGIFALFFVGSVVDDLLLLHGARLLVGFKLLLGKFARLVVSALCLGFLLWLCLLIGNLVFEIAAGLIVSLAAYPILLFATGALDAEDMKIIKGSAAGIWILEWGTGAMMRYLKLFFRI